MKAYGFPGKMNPQNKQKADMSPSDHSKGKKYGQSGYKKGGHDMSPKEKQADEQAVWQNMR